MSSACVIASASRFSIMFHVYIPSESDFPLDKLQERHIVPTVSPAVDLLVSKRAAKFPAVHSRGHETGKRNENIDVPLESTNDAKAETYPAKEVVKVYSETLGKYRSSTSNSASTDASNSSSKASKSLNRLKSDAAISCRDLGPSKLQESQPSKFLINRDVSPKEQRLRRSFPEIHGNGMTEKRLGVLSATMTTIGSSHAATFPKIDVIGDIRRLPPIRENERINHISYLERTLKRAEKIREGHRSRPNQCISSDSETFSVSDSMRSVSVRSTARSHASSFFYGSRRKIRLKDATYTGLLEFK